MNGGLTRTRLALSQPQISGPQPVSGRSHRPPARETLAYRTLACQPWMHAGGRARDVFRPAHARACGLAVSRRNQLLPLQLCNCACARQGNHTVKSAPRNWFGTTALPWGHAFEQGREGQGPRQQLNLRMHMQLQGSISWQ